jgi:hypothetical protein
VAESDEPAPKPDGDTDAQSAGDKAREEQAKQEESGQENPT